MLFKPNKKVKIDLIIAIILITALIIILAINLLETYSNLTYEYEKKEICFFALGLLIIGIWLYIKVLCGWIVANRTIIMSKENCIVSFGTYQKEYRWEDFKIKSIENISHSSKNYTEKVYEKCVIFSLYTLRRPWWKNPWQCNTFHPFSFICIYFRPEEKSRHFYTNYEIEEELFMEKMKEWGIKLEESSFYERRKNVNSVF